MTTNKMHAAALAIVTDQLGLRGMLPTYRARYVAADDEFADDEIVIEKDGQPTGITVQIGRGYCAVNRYEGEGDDFGVVDLYVGDDLPVAAAIAAAEARRA